MRKSGALRIGIVLLLAGVAAGMFALVGRADNPAFDNPSSSLKPGFIDAGKTVLYHTQWHDNDNRTFTHAQVEISVPAGWTLVSSDPTGCTQASAGATVICPWGTLHFDEVVSQDVRLQSNSVTGPAAVNSQLTFYEGPGNPGRINHVASDGPKTVTVLDPGSTPDQAGDCVSGGDSVATVAGSGKSDTSATPGTTSELCTPITIDEQPRQAPDQFCLPNRNCVTDLVTTDAAIVPADNPIKLRITFRGNGLNGKSLIFNSAGGVQREVPPCGDSAVASPDPCWYNKQTGGQSVTWFVNWTGIDPIWDS